MNRKILIPALILTAGIATAAGLAFAETNDGEHDSLADLAKAKITLTQAVGAAEAQAGGKATRAELDNERGTVSYQIEVVTADNKVMDVKVDALDGKILSSKQDQADRGEHEEKDD